MTYKKIKLEFIFIATLLVGVFTLITFLFAAAKDEGTGGNGTIINFFQHALK